MQLPRIIHADPLLKRRVKPASASLLATLSLAVLTVFCANEVSAQPGPTAGPDPLPGAIFTTESTGNRVNQNIFALKEDVYLDGGPKHPGAAGLPAGAYYVRVTNPSGSLLLGSTVGSGNDTPFVVDEGGEPLALYQLTAILVKASDATAGYDDTDNPGGEYKVWVSTSATFDENVTKTDNFKVKRNNEGSAIDTVTLHVVKYYDSNANGVQDDAATEPVITGWRFHVSDDIHLDRHTPISLVLAPGTYTIYQVNPLEINWVQTSSDIVQVTLGAGADHAEKFGHVVIGQRGGRTLGFWSNKNGQAATTTADTAFLASLNLRNANGSNFDPTSKSQIPKWLLSASATNMANMLSAQLATMQLNVRHSNISGVQGSYILYRPELNVFGITYNSGFITIDQLMAAANAALAANGSTVTSGPSRTYQEKLKNALDDGNNNLPFYVLPPNTASIFTF